MYTTAMYGLKRRIDGLRPPDIADVACGYWLSTVKENWALNLRDYLPVECVLGLILGFKTLFYLALNCRCP
jgi:hypothetical protein